MEKKLKKLLFVNFGLYFILLQWFLLVHCGFKANSVVYRMTLPEQACYAGIRESLSPFLEGKVGGMVIEIVSVLLNIVLPVPLVFLFLHLLRDEKETFPKIAFGAILLVMVLFLLDESIQCLSYLGAFQVFDLVVYLLGAILGVLLYARWIRPVEDEKIHKALIVTRNIMLPCLLVVLATTILFVFRYFHFWAYYHEYGYVPRKGFI